MARAGFYAIHNSSIRFGRDGQWYADGQLITNPRIAALFSRHIVRAEGGGYELRIADERAPITVDDTPYVVVGADSDADAVWIELNDGTREPLDPHTLHVGADDVLYCRVKQGSERARFLRPAYYQVAPHISTAADGTFVFRTGTQTVPIASR